jgi:hypothetical protein
VYGTPASIPFFPGGNDRNIHYHGLAFPGYISNPSSIIPVSCLAAAFETFEAGKSGAAVSSISFRM